MVGQLWLRARRIHVEVGRAGTARSVQGTLPPTIWDNREQTFCNQGPRVDEDSHATILRDVVNTEQHENMVRCLEIA